jgi:putative membrane protein
MRLCLVPISLIAVLAMLSPGAAQTTQPHGPGQGNPAGTPAGTHEAAPGKPAPRQLNQADRNFLQAATMGGAAEVEFAQLADRMSRNTGIKQFAQRMIREHQAANQRIATLARNAGFPPTQGLDPDHKATFDRLSKLQGAAFDRAYIDSQIVDHQVMAQLLEYEIGAGQDSELKGLAAQLLPTILNHLQAANAILGTLAPTVAKQP